MDKPQGYDEAQSYTGDFEQLELGGHICKIVGAKIEYTQNTNAEVLVILFDIAEGKQAGYYQKRYDEAKKNNAQAKWQGVYRQFTQGNSTPYFKGMIETIEKSNQGYNFANTGFDERTLIGKLFGGVFGREQYKTQDGKLKFAIKCRNIRTVDTIKKGIDIPEDKLLEVETQDSYFSPNNYDYTEDDLPF